jgi:HEAT repeat protein
MGDEDATLDVATEQRLALLASQIDTEDVERRRLAVSEISNICYAARQRAEAAVPILLRCLSDPDEKIGESALYGLSWCAPVSLESLIDCLDNLDAKVRGRACAALGNIGDLALPACDSLRRLLADPVSDVYLRAAKALGLIHDTSNRTIEALFVMATSKNAVDRRAALHALGNIGKALADPRPLRANESQVLKSLEDEDEGTRWSACYVLASLGLDEAQHVEVLMRRLVIDTSGRVHEMAISQLLKLTPAIDLEAYGPVMCNIVRKGEREARGMCKVLALLGPDAEMAVPYLSEALRSDDGFLVVEAAKALWKIARRADESLPELARVFDDCDESVCDVICEIGPPAAPLIPFVIRALNSGSWDLQWAATDALGAISSRDPDVLGVLVTELGHASSIVRSAAARALAQIGAPAVPILIGILEDHNDHRREWAADALGQMGHRAGAATGVLRANMQSSSHALASWCAISLAKVAGDAAAAPALIGLLARTDRPDLRREAALGLKAIGPPAISAVEALRSAVDDKDEHVRAAVEEALTAVSTKRH